MKKISIYLLILYFIIRGIIFNITFIYFPSIKWISPLLGVLLYAIILTLITIEKDNIYKYYFDKISIIILIFFGFFPRIYIWSLDQIFIQISSWVITSIFIIINKQFLSSLEIKKGSTLKWVVYSLMIGFALTLLYLSPLMIYLKKIDIDFNLIINIIILTINNFNHSSVIEEPIFRGFLLGGLQEKGLNNFSSILIQGIVFGLCHINTINHLYSFLFVIPLVGIILGILTLKTKTITNSMFAHSIDNSIIMILKM